MKLNILVFLIMILNVSLVSANLVIEDVKSMPNEIQPGEEALVGLTIKNEGNETIDDITVALDLAELPFAPLDSTTEKYVGEIKKNDEEDVSFRLVVLIDAKSKIYKVPTQINYENKIKDFIISLKVVAVPMIDLELEESEVLIANSAGEIVFKIINKGLGDVNFMNLELKESDSYEILSPSKVYIGGINSDDFEVVDFKLYLKESEVSLPIKLTFQDEFNNDYTKNENLKLKVYTREEAKQLGLIKEGYNIVVIVTVILFVLLFFMYRKVRKRH